MAVRITGDCIHCLEPLDIVGVDIDSKGETFFICCCGGKNYPHPVQDAGQASKDVVIESPGIHVKVLAGGNDTNFILSSKCYRCDEDLDATNTEFQKDSFAGIYLLCKCGGRNYLRTEAGISTQAGKKISEFFHGQKEGEISEKDRITKLERRLADMEGSLLQLSTVLRLTRQKLREI